VSAPIQAYRASQGAVEKVTVNGLSTGAHTVVITATDANGTLSYSLCGVSGRNASGVVLDQCSRGGQTSDVMNTTNAAAWTSAGGKSWGGSAQNLRGSVSGWNGGASRPCDLALLAFGLNDATTDKTPTNVLNNHRMALESIRAGNPDASVLIVRNHRGAATIDGTQFYYSQYERELQMLAKAWNCGVLNLWAIGKNSYAYMNGLGYWGTANTAVGIAGNDVVHLSDAGHAWVASNVLSVIG
jgi:lysophospholipase L1-like esterase